jgi:hypothetical protein
MCDYHTASKTAVDGLPVPRSQLGRAVGPAAHNYCIRV